jgi:hypothetical protein
MSVHAWDYLFQEKLLSCSRSECTKPRIALVVVGLPTVTVQLKRDGTRRRTGGEVKGKLAIGVGSQYRQYPSHYLGTWYIQHYDR